MAEKAKTAVKKTAPAKTTPKSKSSTRRNLSKGQKLACEVCGMAVTVDQIGDTVVEEDTLLVCCGEPMKAKVPAKKTAKK